MSIRSIIAVSGGDDSIVDAPICATITRCTTMNISSSSPTMIRVQDCSAPMNEITVLIVP